MHKFNDITYEKSDNIARITINRPEVYNAFRMQTLEEMCDAFSDANTDGNIRVIILTGSGDKAFCTGGDVSVEKDLDAASGRRMLSKGMILYSEMRNNGKPIIAAVKGLCIAGGNELNLLCDLTIASENAKFGHAGPKVGSVPVWGGTQLLPRLVGDKRAREIIYLCRMYNAHEALAMGWINKVVPLDEVDKEVDKWCQELLAKSPSALRIAKTSLNFESDLLYPSLMHGSALLNFLHGTEEFKEGMAAFLEKRKPNFDKYSV